MKNPTFSILLPLPPRNNELYTDSYSVWEWTATVEDGWRVLRGGSWNNLPAHYLRAAYRLMYNPVYRSNYYGFRVARDIPYTPEEKDWWRLRISIGYQGISKDPGDYSYAVKNLLSGYRVNELNHLSSARGLWTPCPRIRSVESRFSKSREGSSSVLVECWLYSSPCKVPEKVFRTS